MKKIVDSGIVKTCDELDLIEQQKFPSQKGQYNCLLYQKKTLCSALLNEPYDFVKKIRRFRIGGKTCDELVDI